MERLKGYCLLSYLDLLFSALYISCAVLLAIYGMSTVILVTLFLYHRPDRPAPAPPPPDSWPSVVVQLPIYNEAHVIRRLLDSVAALDYPRDRLSIQVLDDSTDHTTALIQACVKRYRAAGLDIHHLRRPTREGYKAGALAYGLQHSQAEIAAVFDADFAPPPDFLRQTVPHLTADSRVGVVQARWGYLNDTDNLLTRAQTLSIDMYFMVEQGARSWAGLTLAFSGSAGIWRRACIDDAGGWQASTLTEDMDLSYRAQLRGWRLVFVPHVEVPSELPPQLAAYKRQQARWAKGTTQCLLALGPQLLRARLGFFRGAMGLVHLCQYLVHPLVLLLLLVTPPLILSGTLTKLHLSFLGVLSMAPLLAYALSQRALYPQWPRRLLVLPALILLGAGATINNTAAVCSALFDRSNVFLRTPKFGDIAWHSSRYALRTDRTLIGELALAVYAAVGALLALRHGVAAVAPFFALYALASGGMALFTLLDAWRVTRWTSSKPPHRRARISNR